MSILQCEISDECSAPVTHIGSKGYIYCTEHARLRHDLQYESTRRLRPWELKLLEAGERVPSYTPISKAEWLESLVTK